MDIIRKTNWINWQLISDESKRIVIVLSTNKSSTFSLKIVEIKSCSFHTFKIQMEISKPGYITYMHNYDAYQYIENCNWM